jgi:PAS domain S-box-containing protein
MLQQPVDKGSILSEEGFVSPKFGDLLDAFAESMSTGIAYCRMLYQDGRPADFIYLYTNPAFHQHSGLGYVLGKRISELLPGFRQANVEVLESYGRVARGGASESFEVLVPALQRWIAVQVQSAAPDHFIAVFTDITQRKRAELDLVQLLEEKKGMLDSELLGIVKLRDRHLLWANTGFQRMLGYPIGELLGRTSRMFFRSDFEHAEFGRLADPVLKAGKVFRTELQQKRRDGTLGWYEIQCAILGDGSADVLAMLVDIGERKAAQSALIESEARLKEAQRIGHIGSWECHVTGERLVWSEEMARLYGLPAGVAEVTLDDWLRQLHPDDREPTLLAYRCALGERRPLDLTHRVIRPDGQSRYLHVRGELAQSFDARPERMTGTAQDVTSRVRQERILRLNEAHLRSVFDAMSEGVVVQTLDGPIVDANAAAEQILGLTRDQLLGKTSMDPGWHAVHEDGTPFPGSEHPAILTLKTGCVVRNQIMGVHVPGKGMRWISINSNPIFGEGSEHPVAAAVTFTDKTESRRIAIELGQHREDLERLVEERTAQLSVAKDAAESANRAKTTFLANMSHELRTPLNAIVGMSEKALRQAREPEQKATLGKVILASRHLLGIINDVLDISKIETGSVEIDKVEFTIRTVVDSMVALIEDTLQAKGLSLSLDLAKDLGERVFLGDPMRLGQVLLNLLSNAVKFTATGTISIAIELLQEAELATVVRFEVRDRGIGIEADQLPRMFEAFEQAASTLASGSGGTGLGLAITRHLVEMMGGSISATSTPGVGSVFWFTARLGHPTQTAEAAVVTGAHSTEELGALIRRDFPRARLLVVDDDETNREIIDFFLAGSGLRLDFASGGHEALERARVVPFAAILMDVRMPDLDGIETTRRIHAGLQNRGTPIIAMTANAFAEDKERCALAGMHDFIAKPLDAAQLLAAVLAALRRREP